MSFRGGEAEGKVRGALIRHPENSTVKGIDALAERIAILPVAVSPVPLFKQMEKLEGPNKDLEDKLLKVKDINLSQRLVSIETFEEFAEIARKTLKDNRDFNMKRSLLQKFVQRVEIGVDAMKIFWNLDQEFYECEFFMLNLQILVRRASYLVPLSGRLSNCGHREYRSRHRFFIQKG